MTGKRELSMSMVRKLRERACVGISRRPRKPEIFKPRRRRSNAWLESMTECSLHWSSGTLPLNPELVPSHTVH
jgi:hypothetical protein